jgi:hypothetical protein
VSITSLSEACISASSWEYRSRTLFSSEVVPVKKGKSFFRVMNFFFGGGGGAASPSTSIAGAGAGAASSFSSLISVYACSNDMQPWLFIRTRTLTAVVSVAPSTALAVKRAIHGLMAPGSCEGSAYTASRSKASLRKKVSTLVLGIGLPRWYTSNSVSSSSPGTLSQRILMG